MRVSAGAHLCLALAIVSVAAVGCGDGGDLEAYCSVLMAPPDAESMSVEDPDYESIIDWANRLEETAPRDGLREAARNMSEGWAAMREHSNPSAMNSEELTQARDKIAAAGATIQTSLQDDC